MRGGLDGERALMRTLGTHARVDWAEAASNRAAYSCCCLFDRQFCVRSFRSQTEWSLRASTKFDRLQTTNRTRINRCVTWWSSEKNCTTSSIPRQASVIRSCDCSFRKTTITMRAFRTTAGTRTYFFEKKMLVSVLSTWSATPKCMSLVQFYFNASFQRVQGSWSFRIERL